ncbi:type I-C CRISPR-associated protein Cas8c/Csd1 [Acanthopleuribacter pedis]|uniref:Type I-C CRISPR-associated protein Cas8c/Csd1 n=1 Tax=Acanthopleuribacter pedis TaxID=442870 RepID=A0A8J7Q9I3_9BACT|nr:type I-C CRISPR-associated protein Cas8c/Csd1 [Acanthopleuribacter pedis]MBO1319444.1 type I-C CRISPR-associated protein Cas8c/Csd1 [Acanthopleuribacter pedis]
MIVQSLLDLAEREKLIEEPGLQLKPLDWEIHINAAGDIQRLVQRVAEDAKQRPKAMIPTRLVRSSGVRPQLLVDKADYAVGVSDSVKATASVRDKSKKVERLRQSFVQMIAMCRRIADETDSALVAAQVRAMEKLLAEPALLFAHWHVAGKSKTLYALDDTFRQVPADWLGNHLFGYVVDGKRVWEDPPVEAWLHENIFSFYEVEGAGEIRCLGYGELMKPVDKHIVFDFPGDTGQLPLVSFNNDADYHYGAKNNENAPFSAQASFGIAAAIARLQGNGEVKGQTAKRQCVRLNDNTLALYWSDQEQQAMDLNVGLDEAEEDEILKAEQVWKKIAFSGRPDAVSEDLGRLFTLIMSREKSRMVIRSARLSSLPQVAARLLTYFEELAIVSPWPDRELRGYRGLRRLVDAVYPRQPGGKRLREPPPDLLNRLWNCALFGDAYPDFLLGELLRNARLPTERNTRGHGAMALIKAILQRNYKDTSHRTEEIRMDINAEHPSQAYHEGRLFALLQEIQRLALGDVNAGIGDRYLGNAMVSPRQSFPRLLKLMTHHLHKGRDGDRAGALFNREREVIQVMARIRDNFSEFLNLPEQGLFMLGYHHQRAALVRPSTARKEKAAETPITEAEEK